MHNVNMDQEETSVVPSVISCLLRKDKQTERWEGHCLDFDIVTSGSSEDIAWNNLKKVVRRHVEQCFNDWQPGLQRRAAQCHWNEFEDLHKKKVKFRQDKLSLCLVKPREDGEHWLRALAFPEVMNGSAATAHLPC